MIKIDKITLNNFKFFIDEEEHNTFELNGQNMLVYGENGSGKSSIYKAFEIYEEGFEIPFVKKSNSLTEQAKYQKHYDCVYKSKLESQL